MRGRAKAAVFIICGTAALVACSLSLDGYTGGTLDAGAGGSVIDASAEASAEAGVEAGPAVKCGACDCTPLVDGVTSANLIGDARILGSYVELTPDEGGHGGGVAFPATFGAPPRLYVSLELSVTTSPTDQVGDGFGIGWLDENPLGACLNSGSQLCVFGPERAGVAGVVRFFDPGTAIKLDHVQLAVMDATLVNSSSPADANTISVPTESIADLGAADPTADPPAASWHPVELFVSATPTPKMKIVVNGAAVAEMKMPFTFPAAGAIAIGAGTGETIARYAIRNVRIATLAEDCAF